MSYWQDLTALLLVAAAAVYAARQLWRRALRKRCTNCTACGRPLVQIEPRGPSEQGVSPFAPRK